MHMCRNISVNLQTCMFYHVEIRLLTFRFFDPNIVLPHIPNLKTYNSRTHYTWSERVINVRTIVSIGLPKNIPLPRETPLSRGRGDTRKGANGVIPPSLIHFGPRGTYENCSFRCCQHKFPRCGWHCYYL